MSLLVGTRHGCIFEIQLELENIDKSNLSFLSDLSEDKDESVPTSIQGFKTILYSQSHASQNPHSSKKLFFAHHPKLPILATIGDDQQLIIHHSQQNIIIKEKYFKETPTVVKFTPDGDILVVGFLNGQITLLDAQIQQQPYSGFSEDEKTLSLAELPFENDPKQNNAILNIEFSSQGQIMVVSFYNLKSFNFYDVNQKQNSYITVYINKFSNRFGKFQLQEKSIYQKYTDIKNPSINETYVT